MRGRRTVIMVAVAGLVAVGAFALADRHGNPASFAELPGDADVQLIGAFTPHQVKGIAALPQAAAVECGTTLHGVTVGTSRGVLPGATVLTAPIRPQLRWSAVRSGTYPTGPGELLVDEHTATRHTLHVGDRLTLSRGTHVVNATVAGIAARPRDRSVGDREPVLTLPAASVTTLDGGAPCAAVTVELKRRQDAGTFSRDAEALLEKPPAVIYDDSLRGHV